MAARKRRTLPRTMAVSPIRNGRVYFWLAACRTISTSGLASGWVSKSLSCGCCLLTAVCRVRTKLTGRSPIKLSWANELRFRNVPNANVVHRRVPLACHDDLLFLAKVGQNEKSAADYGAIGGRVKRFFPGFYGPYSAPGGGSPLHLVSAQSRRARCAARSRLFAPGTCHRARDRKSRRARRTR